MKLIEQDYRIWLYSLKERIQTAQIRATQAVNSELVMLYWDIGQSILDKQNQDGWGSKVIERLAIDLRSTFPEMKGFSRSNLLYMRSFSETWPDRAIVQQLVGLLPWGHNLVLLSKLKTQKERLWYANAAILHGWSRNILTMQIETCLHKREGKAITNFEQRLPIPQSKLRCYVVVELKATDFKPEYAGQLNFYLAAIDAQIKTNHDQPTIGLLLCKSKNKVVAEYALRNIDSPIGVSEYQLIESLPKELETSLPSIEKLQFELKQEREAS